MTEIPKSLRYPTAAEFLKAWVAHVRGEAVPQPPPPSGPFAPGTWLDVMSRAYSLMLYVLLYSPEAEFDEFHRVYRQVASRAPGLSREETGRLALYDWIRSQRHLWMLNRLVPSIFQGDRVVELLGPSVDEFSRYVREFVCHTIDRRVSALELLAPAPWSESSSNILGVVLPKVIHLAINYIPRRCRSNRCQTVNCLDLVFADTQLDGGWCKMAAFRYAEMLDAAHGSSVVTTEYHAYSAEVERARAEHFDKFMERFTHRYEPYTFPITRSSSQEPNTEEGGSRSESRD